LVKKKDVSKLKDIFSANRKIIFLVDGSKNTLLHWAAQYSVPEIVQDMLQRGVSALTRNKEGATPFHQAASYNNVDVMKILVGHEKKGLNEQDSDLYTPLHYACLSNCHDIVKFLTQQDGINVNLKSKKGKKADEVYAKTREDIKKLIMICRAKN